MTTAKAVHTPTPWLVKIGEWDGIFKQCAVCSADGRIAEMFYVSEKGENDAAHIVRCANNFDALCAALENLIHNPGSATSDAAQEVLDRARA